MADDERKFRTLGFYWSNEDPEDDGQYTSGTHLQHGVMRRNQAGVTAAGNIRPKKRKSVKSGRNKGAHTRNIEVPSKPTATAVSVLTPRSKNNNMDSVVEKKEKEKENRNVSLKDLCVEDKKRVANLIKELARLGEEKETMTDLLTNERELFEEQIKDVLSQQEKILAEREEIQGQLTDCQDLIVKYQVLLKENKADGSSAKSAISSGVSNSTKTSAPTVSSKSRPFTMIIDRLINEEKLDSASNEDRELKLGPLINPTFESTQSSDFDFKSAEFKPLSSETTVGSLSQYTIGDNDGESKNDEQIQFDQLRHDNTDLNSNIEPDIDHMVPIPEDLDDQDFLKCYRELKPEQRKQQLFLQKQSLLQEQDRLKKILSEQETLLNVKQQQLRQQQENQKKRLSYFEKTGSFPQNYDSGHIDHATSLLSHGNNNHRVSFDNKNPHDRRFQMDNYADYVPFPTRPVLHTANQHHYGGKDHSDHLHNGYHYHQNEDSSNTQFSHALSVPHTHIYKEVDTQTSFHQPTELHTHISKPNNVGKPLPSKNVYHPTFGQSRIKKKIVGNENVDKLLLMVDEADSLYEDSQIEDPLRQYLKPSRKIMDDDEDLPIPVDLFQDIDTIYDNKQIPAHRYEKDHNDKAYFETYASDLSHESVVSQDDLDESHVLEDVFFIK